MHAKLAKASVVSDEDVPRVPLVVMDPGTRFNTRNERGMNRSNPANHYIVETWEEIATHPPPLHDHGLLLCWATQANQHIMQRIVTDRWGLTIKSLFTWDKIIIGMGYWGRSRYEYLIIATKGRGLRVPLPSDRTPNGFIEKARRGFRGHSRKPEAFYQWVEEHYANVPKHEMNCRYPREGWAVSGNEAGSLAERRLSASDPQVASRPGQGRITDIPGLTMAAGCAARSPRSRSDRCRTASSETAA